MKWYFPQRLTLLFYYSFPLTRYSLGKDKYKIKEHICKLCTSTKAVANLKNFHHYWIESNCKITRNKSLLPQFTCDVWELFIEIKVYTAMDMPI